MLTKVFIFLAIILKSSRRKQYFYQQVNYHPTTMDHTPLLKYIKEYINLTSKEEALLISKTISKNYLKDTYIIQQGNTCKSIHFIISGCTKTFHADKKGQEHIIAFAIENWWTADLGSFITQQDADFSVQCMENTQLIQFTHDNLEVLYKEIPALERLFRKIIERAFISSQKRIIRNFSLTAKERYLIFKNNYPAIEQRVPQYMIASYLGITKEFLSKIKSQLAHAK